MPQDLDEDLHGTDEDGRQGLDLVKVVVQGVTLLKSVRNDSLCISFLPHYGKQRPKLKSLNKDANIPCPQTSMAPTIITKNIIFIV